MKENSIEENWSMLTSRIETLKEKYIPQYKYTIPNRTPIDSETREIIRDKHRKWKNYMRAKTEERYKLYCKSRNKVKKVITQKRREFENNIALDIKKNPKKAWKFIKSKYKVKENVHYLLTNPEDPKSEVTTTDKEKAIMLQKFFCSVFTEETDGIMPECEMYDITHKMQSNKITQNEVKVLLT